MFDLSALLPVLFKAFWCGLAALGFGMLFNSPKRALVFIFGGGFLVGLVKFILMLPSIGAGIISASFIAAVAVGLASIPIAHASQVPPVIFSIPSVIPLVPGVFAYRTMMGLMRMALPNGNEASEKLASTFQNGAITLFVIMGIALGVALPMHILRKKTVKGMASFRNRKFKLQ
ncbi:MAG: threonine/serine exporter family protein [Chitinophagaceae bacterium]|nr:threonine/serine exporter family protein [Chitinophagaceae bacterium]MCU0403141.1 threonine/serine exporter family protein [Chitinophagaceae bacterium]